MITTYKKRTLPGIALCFLIAYPAWRLGQLLPIIGGPVFAILFGIIITTFFPNLISKNFSTDSTAFSLGDGVKYTSKKLLQYSIILLGFEMNLYNVIKIGGQALSVMIFTLSAALITAYIIGRSIKIPGKLAILIGVGTSICGGSAIAATAPVINAKDEDVAHAISTIFLFNILAVFLFPALGHLFHMSDSGFGIWAGTAVNDTSSVVAAATAWSITSGNNTALVFATIVKLTRTLMIVPITLILAIYTAKTNKKAAGDNAFSFVKVFPWFVLGFVAVAIINTFVNFSYAHSLVTIGKFIIVMAMVAIGLNTNIKKLISNGFQPIFLGLCCWFAVAITAIIVQYAMKLW